MDRVTVWDDRLDADERALLTPGRPLDLDRSPDVLVVGGGAIGLAAAVFARRAGLGRVVLIERAPRLAPGASSGNGGAIAPDMHVATDSPEFVAFGRRSRQLYRDLDAEWEHAIGTWPTRWLDIRPAGTFPERSAATGSDQGGPRPLSESDVRELEPDVRLPDGAEARLAEGQLAVDPLRLALALAARAGQVVTGVGLLGVSVHGDRVGTVHTTAGDFTPGALIVATGLVPPPWHRRVPQRWVKGHMLAVAPGPWRLGSVLAGPFGGGTPLPGGGVVCGGTFDEGDRSREVRPEVADPMAKGLATLIPAAADARISHRWCCFRPQIEDRQPVVDRLPEVTNGWFAGGHFTTGIMMAPATGAALAEWAASGRAPDGVSTFTLPPAPLHYPL
ncbi:NAD(P)/FAD-dependent oxidoreductase [Dactylosporangium matsuzakiense]|uniref:NAD(P)/FAD-dependent oxidoreductase n=1 Tax=Dactylosporangium matsuzakiense TaxID=53360 RepID=UPI0021C2AEBB|nr:FAD-binding oxidoreductase [Dactylosporangium matsuzakiense]UWZ46774.1 FAD-binding oxidoreductase [Dactylosporangium matsuzakiense]